MRFATLTVIDFRGYAPRGCVSKMEGALEADPHVGAFQIETLPGRLAVSADVLSTDFIDAGVLAYQRVGMALKTAGYDRATLVLESSVVPVLDSVKFTRPKRLRQLGYAA